MNQSSVPVISDVRERNQATNQKALKEDQNLSANSLNDEIAKSSDSREANSELTDGNQAPKKMSRFKQQRQGLRT